MTLDEKIEAETKLIAELESSSPKWYPELCRYHEDNKPWEIHQTAIRDAYWRRRMFIAEKEGLPSPHEVY